jgi:hypothetical protein
VFMCMLVLDDPGRLDALLDAWHGDGIYGATILPSTGLHRRRAMAMAARAAAGLPRVVERAEEGHYTLLVVVDTEATVRRCLAVAERVTGDLDLPDTGMFVAWPLAVTKGAGPPVDG